MQDRRRQFDEIFLQRTAGPYIWVKLRRTQCEQMSSGLPLKADNAQYSRHVSKVPKPEVTGYHSIFVTESGNTMIACGLTVAAGCVRSRHVASGEFIRSHVFRFT